MMSGPDHLTAAAEHLAAADRALVGKQPNPQRAAHYATVAGGHYLAALCAGHRPLLADSDHGDVYADWQPDSEDPARRIEAERDQLAAQVAELTERLNDTTGQAHCDRAALARIRKLATRWGADGRIPSGAVTDLTAALDGGLSLECAHTGHHDGCDGRTQGRGDRPCACPHPHDDAERGSEAAEASRG